MHLAALALVALVLALGPVHAPAPAGPPPFPWSTFSGAAKEAVGADTVTCTGKEQVLMAGHKHDGVEWLYAVNLSNGRYVFARFGASGAPDFLYFGVADMDAPAPEHDAIHIRSARAYDEKIDGAGPCAYLVGGDA